MRQLVSSGLTQAAQCVAGSPPCLKDVLLQPAAQLPLLPTLRDGLPAAHRQRLEPALRHLLRGLPCCGLPTARGHHLPGPHPQLLPSRQHSGHLVPTGAGPPQGPAGLPCLWGLLVLLLLLQPALRRLWAMLSMAEGVDSRRNSGGTDGKTWTCS